jgi:hypothetical protein
MFKLSAVSRLTIVDHGYVPPTPKALAGFMVTTIESAIHVTVAGESSDNDEEEVNPTTSANVDLRYHDARTRISVPGIEAGHLLDALTCTCATGGIVFACISILRSDIGLPDIRLGLCALCVIVIGGLASLSIRRNRA